MSLLLMLGAVKSKGLYDLTIQRSLQHHCEAGRIQEVADLVAQALYEDALITNKIPEPKGVLTTELGARMEDGARSIVLDYAKRGVLVAKGFYPAQQLLLLFIKLWEAQFASALVPEQLSTMMMSENEFNFGARSTVAAQALFELLKLKMGEDGVISIPMSDVEAVCMEAVKVIHRAFNDPDTVVHELLHGETPMKEGT